MYRKLAFGLCPLQTGPVYWIGTVVILTLFRPARFRSSGPPGIGPRRRATQPPARLSGYVTCW